MIAHGDEIARHREPFEVDRLVVARAAAEPGRVGAARALDQHLLLGADEAAAALQRAALDELHEPLHPLALQRVGSWSGSEAASVPRRGENMNVNAES